MAPQLTATKGCSARGPPRWIIRAASSLPLPDSPLMYTGAWLFARRSIMLRTCSIAGDTPRSWYPAAGCGLSGTLSACLTSARSCSSATGLAR